MPILFINGQEEHIDVEWVSHKIYLHYQSGQAWDPNHYSLVNIGDVIDVWITEEEKRTLSALNDFTELENFVDSIEVKAIVKEKITEWKNKQT